MQIINKEGQRCFFAEITSILKEQPQTLYQAHQPNTQYYISQADKSIKFLTRGGNQFSFPLDVELNAVFPLPEGLLLGCGKDEHSYTFLMNHPMGNITPLGIYDQTLDKVEPWLHSQEEIIYAHRYLPIIIAYNSQQMKHSVHILKVNQSQEFEKLESQRYFLNSEFVHSKLVSEVYYEENIKEEKARLIKIIHGNNDGEILICLLSDTTLRILEMNFCDQNYHEGMEEEQQKRNIFNTLKLVQIIQNVDTIQGNDIIQFEQVEVGQVTSSLKQQLKAQNNILGYTAYQILHQNCHYIHHNLLLFHTNHTFTLMNGSKVIISYSLNESVEDIKQFNTCPQISHPLLQLVLNALKCTIDPQQYMCLLKDVIVNCLHNQQLKFDNAQNAQDLTQLGNEFQKFTYLMMFYLKISGNKKDGEESVQKRVKRDSNINTPNQSPIREQQSKAFNKLLASNYHRKQCNYQVPQMPIVNDRKFISFTYHMTLEMFGEISEKILYVLHLLYHDINLHDQKMASQLLYFLYCYAQNLDTENSVNYVDYYVRIEPSLQLQYFSDNNILLLPSVKSLARLGQQVKTQILPPNPVDLSKWFNGLLTNNPTSFPILFENTKQFCTILQSLNPRALIHLSSLLKTSFQDFQHNGIHKPQQFPLFYQKVLNQQAHQQHLINKSSKQRIVGSVEGAPLVLYKLSEKKYNKDKLNKLPLMFQLPLLEIISTVRLNFPQILMGHLTKDAFIMIDRMDLYRNSKLYFQKPKVSELKKYVHSIVSGQMKSLDHYSEEQFEFPYDKHQMNQVKKLFDYSKDIRVKLKLTEHIPEERLDQDAPAVLQKLLNRKLSMFLGLGSLTYGTSDSFITDQIRFPALNLSGVLVSNSLKLTIDPTKEEYTSLTQWPEFNLGVALALQLSKKLKGLSPESLRTWIFYQKPQVPSNIHGGFMLGLGLLGYLASFNQIDLYQLLTQNHEATSVGVLLGIGASRVGSCDEPTQKSLTIHIPSLIPSVYDLELPSNVSTSALCALGFLFMSSGNRNFTEVALGLIGRKPMNDKITDREGYSVAAGIALGLINLGKGSVWRRELQIEDRLIRFIQGGLMMPPPQSSLSTSFIQNETHISSIKEGNMVNIHISCPAALMALALMFMQTEQSNIVDRLNIPNSFSSLEQCNPNHIILKSVTRNLIMWNEIPINKDNLYNQIPELIRFLFEQPLKQIHQRYYIVYNIEVIDFMSVSMIYTGIIVGGLLAIGIKYAGTHDNALKQMMLAEFEFLIKLKISQNEFANDPDAKCSLEQYTYYTNLVNTLQAMALLMAGSFDIDVLNAAKTLRHKLEAASIWHFGFHQPIMMSIGILHLGRGGYSFNKDQKATAMLLLTSYPHYPTSTSDNKQYLQALRWSYVMAIQPKIFRMVDCVTSQVAQVEAEISYNQIDKENQAKNINTINIQDNKYLPLNLNFENSHKSIQTVYVQSKCLSRICGDLLNQKQILQNISTLIEIKDYDKIAQKLKRLPQWKYVKQLPKLQPYLQLIAQDQNQFLPLLMKLQSSQSTQHIPTLRAFYKYSKSTIMPKEAIAQLCTSESVNQSELSAYIQFNDQNTPQSLYRWLAINNIPSYHDLKQVKAVVKQIPMSILEFYLYRSFGDVEQSKLKLIAQLFQQS